MCGLRIRWQLHIIFYSVYYISLVLVYMCVWFAFPFSINKHKVYLLRIICIHIFSRSFEFDSVFVCIQHTNNGIMLEFVAHHKTQVLSFSDKTNATRLIYWEQSKRLIMLIYRFDIFYVSFFFFHVCFIWFSFSLKIDKSDMLRCGPYTHYHYNHNHTYQKLYNAQLNFEQTTTMMMTTTMQAVYLLWQAPL